MTPNFVLSVEHRRVRRTRMLLVCFALVTLVAALLPLGAPARVSAVALAGQSAATEAQFQEKAHRIAKRLGKRFGRTLKKPLIVRFSQDQPENPLTGGRAPARTSPARRSHGAG